MVIEICQSIRNSFFRIYTTYLFREILEIMFVKCIIYLNRNDENFLLIAVSRWNFIENSLKRNIVGYNYDKLLVLHIITSTA